MMKACYVLMYPEKDGKGVIKPVDKAKKYVNAKNLSEALNADLSQADFIVWQGNQFDELKQISPKKPPYGWMLVSVKKPILVQLTAIEQLDELNDIVVDGFIAEQKELLQMVNEKYNLD